MNENKTTFTEDFPIVKELDELECIEIEPEWIEHGIN